MYSFQQFSHVFTLYGWKSSTWKVNSILILFTLINVYSFEELCNVQLILWKSSLIIWDLLDAKVWNCLVSKGKLYHDETIALKHVSIVKRRSATCLRKKYLIHKKKLDSNFLITWSFKLQCLVRTIDHTVSSS